VPYRFQVGVQFIYQRDPCRDFEADDPVIRNVIEEFDQGPYAVAMGRNQDSLSIPQTWHYCFMPVWDDTAERIRERFGRWQLVIFEMRIPQI
jgi:hypothetical protein